MMRTFLFWLASRLPCRIISDGNTPYLERYYLFTVLGWRFYLHRFVGSDPDSGLHDHPWSRAFSIILAGWYWEHTRAGVRKVRWFNSLTGDSFHRVVLPLAKYTDPYLDQPCWTLFFHRAAKVKAWGFWREAKVSDLVIGDDGHLVGKQGAVFVPYVYTRTDEVADWWNRVPKGRDEPRRAAP